jgi:histone acetyltransferase
MYFLAYADNSAIAYFQKQGFMEDVSLPESKWIGFIKDYEGATLMQCTMLPSIRYLQAGRMFLKQKEIAQAKIRSLTKSHIIHQPPPQCADIIAPIDPHSIPAITATGWSPAMDAPAGGPRRGRHFNMCKVFLDRIGDQKHAWPFLKPVDKREVPDYYKIITSSMDLTSMEEKLEHNFYTTSKLFIDDLRLIFSNCQRYNNKTTIHVKCAVELEKYMWSLVRENREWGDVLQD